MSNYGGLLGTAKDPLSTNVVTAKTLPKNPIINELTANEVSKQVLLFVEDLADGKQSFTQDRVDRVVDLLGKLSRKIDLLPIVAISDNVLSSINKLVEICPANLDLDSSSLRINLEKIATRAPLLAGVFNFVSTNIAIQVKALSASNVENLKFSEVDLSHDAIDRLGIQMIKGNAKPSDNEHQLLVEIPMQSVLRTLSEHEKQNLKRLSVSVYKNATLFNNRNAHSHIIGRVISVMIPGVTIKNLDENVELAFRYDNVVYNFTLLRCVYWNPDLNGGLGNWARDGCRLVSSTRHVTKCGCNHLTTFALLLDIYGDVQEMSDDRKLFLSILSVIACSISATSLTLTLLTYGLFASLRGEIKSRILINLSLALLLANLLFLMQSCESNSENVVLCKSIAISLHYFLLSSLAWMAVEAFYMYLSVIRVFNIQFSHILLKFAVVGWGMPFIVTLLTTLDGLTNNYGMIRGNLCWIKTPALYSAFVLPVGLIMLLNCIVFTLVFTQMKRMSTTGDNQSSKKDLGKQLKGAFVIMILLGPTWSFAFVTVDSGAFIFSVCFTISNSLQGFFIFLIYCALKPEARDCWEKLIRRRPEDDLTSAQGENYTTPKTWGITLDANLTQPF